MSPPSGFPKPHIEKPTQAHTSTIIALHPLGSCGFDFRNEFFKDKSSDNLTLSEHFPGCKWVFPSSQQRFSTLYQDDINKWFDIYSLKYPSQREELQVEGLGASVRRIMLVIDEEVEFTHPSNIVLMGIGQGCATAIHVLLAGRFRLGGFIGVNGWMPLRENLLQETKTCIEGLSLKAFYERWFGLEDVGLYDVQANAATPVLLTHCANGGAVDVKDAEQMAGVLKAFDVDLVCKRFAPGGYGIGGPRGIDTIVKFLSPPAWM